MLNQPNSTNKPTDNFIGGNILSPSFSMHFSMHLLGNNIIHNLEDGNWRCDHCSFLAARFGFPIQHLSGSLLDPTPFFRGNVNFPRRQRCNKCPGKLRVGYGGGLEERIVGEVDLKQMKGANEYMFFVITYSLGSLSMCNLIKTHQIPSLKLT